MVTPKYISIACNILGSIVALAASWYWFKSAKTNLPSFDPKTGKPAAPVGMLEMGKTITESSQANKIAAFLTGISVILMSAGSLLTI